MVSGVIYISPLAIGAAVMGEPAAPIAPLGDVDAWILEPNEGLDLFNAMLERGATIRTASGVVLTEPVI